MSKRGFLVAAEHYPDSKSTSPELPGTIAAVNRFADWLREIHGVPEDQLFLCSSAEGARFDATRAGIVDAGHELICQSQADRNGTEQLFVYVAGHGVTVNDSQAGHDIFLCSDFVEPNRSGAACIDIHEWIDWFASELGVGNHFWFVDACRTPVTAMNPASLGITRSTNQTALANWFQLASAAPGRAAANDATFVSSLLDALSGNCKLVSVPAQEGRYAVTFDNVADSVLKTLESKDCSGYSQSSGDAPDCEITTVIRQGEVETITKDGQKLPPVELLIQYDEAIFIGNTNDQLPQFLFEAFAHRGRRRWRKLEVIFNGDLNEILAFRPDQTLERLRAKRDATEKLLRASAAEIAIELRIYHSPYIGFFGSLWGNDTQKRRAHITTAFLRENIRETRSRDYIDYPHSRSSIIEDYFQRVDERIADGTMKCVFDSFEPVEFVEVDPARENDEAEHPPLLEPIHPEDRVPQRENNDVAPVTPPPLDDMPPSSVRPALDELESLKIRFEQAFADRSLEEELEQERKIIGSRVDRLVADAEQAREKLLDENGERPSPKQMAALAQAIRLRRPAPPCKPDGPTRLPNNELYADVWPSFQSDLLAAQPSIARIERVDDPDAGDRGRSAVGTGFLVEDGLLLTAAHVVRALTRGPMEIEAGQAVADFRAYSGAAGHDRCDILHLVHFDSEFDLAVLKVDSSMLDATIERPFLSPHAPTLAFGTPIGVVGCPLEDSFEQASFMRAVFSNYEFGVKRVAVGAVLGHDECRFAHDCSTLGGNSGSPVFDLASGAVVGVHVRGASLLQNEAVRGERVRSFVEWSIKQENPHWVPHVSHVVTQTDEDPFRGYVEDLRRRDPDIVHEMDEMEAFVGPLIDQVIERPRVAKAIVMRTGRPVLDIIGGETLIEPSKIESDIWTQRLEDAASVLAENVPAVGRIELVNHPRGVDWIGTGWLLHSNIVVTNRHVVDTFGRKSDGGFVFRPGLEDGPMEARIDFLEEFDREACKEFPLYKILHIEPDSGPDLAFLRVEPVRGEALPAPVRLTETPAVEGDPVAVIGYPARDHYFSDPEEMDRIFDYRYDKKRLAPGLVSDVTPTRVYHDCTTLGGNSGGAVVSLNSGRAVALHFAGTAFRRNHAIPAQVVGDRLDDVLSGRVRRSRARTPSPDPTSVTVQPTVDPAPVDSPVPTENPVHGTLAEDGCLEATIPIHLRIQLGKPEN
ncbi:MAG: trypsin-like peptidase domain-containing protein [Planctomycetota bacterium]